jgi:mannose-1-phosphate guanylyltransferase
MLNHLHIVILAGGSGTRFWPASRRHYPKQLLPLAGRADEPLIAATVRRVAPIVAPENVWVSTSSTLVDGTAKILPRIERNRFLAEPVARNTAPCIGWATATIARSDPEAVIAVLPADHFIADEPGFCAVVERAVRAAAEGWLTTIGIVPTRPETGYGYIEAGEVISEGVHAAARFIEKPTRERAERLVADGRYLWNAGMFFYSARVMLAAIAEHLPALADGLSRIDRGAARGDEAAVLATVFPTLPAISIDHGVMEKADHIAVVPGSFGWNDVGSWQATWEMAHRDSQGNSLPPNSIAIDAHDNLVRDHSRTAHSKRWALVGVRDLCIVETDDAVLVIPRERAQDVRAIVDELKARGEMDRT